MNEEKTKIFVFNSPGLDKFFSDSSFEEEFFVIPITSTEILPESHDFIMAIDCSDTSQISVLAEDVRAGATRATVVAFTKNGDSKSKIRLLDEGAASVPDISSDKDLVLHEFIALSEKLGRLKKEFLLDPKTRIYNKRSFLLSTSRLIHDNPNKKYAIIRFNIDNFKLFNDIFGFDAGDKILFRMGKAFREAEYGGMTYGYLYADHFVVCAEQEKIEPQTLAESTTALVQSMHSGFDFNVRLGIYNITDPDVEISFACDCAGVALYSIKNDYNRRFAYYEESMTADLKKEQELTAKMADAIKNEEFKVYLQPQYDYTTDTLIGAEALVRWLRDDEGLIPPGDFIPVFEKNGFITQLDEFVWDKTCQLQRKWLDMNINPVPVSVNISRRDIYNSDILMVFEKLLVKYKLDPSLLRLEITESAYMENPEQLINVVETLRKRGFCVEMDDFGSGYSSLNTLKNVPVDILKLDMKFIANGTPQPGEDDASSYRGGMILSSVVRMANHLNLPVIAEGIESKNQADYLKSLGCFQMQGYYFARPMPSEKYEELLMALPPAERKGSIEDKKNIINFLDPSAQSTMLFNTFIGGTAIIERTGDSVEAIRINDQFFEELCTTRNDFEANKDFLEIMEDESRKEFLSVLTKVKETGKDSFCEIRCNPTGQEGQKLWLRARLRYLSSAGTSDIYYLSIDNIDFQMQYLQANTAFSSRLSSIMETVPCGIITFECKEKLSMIYLNETAASMFGYSYSDFKEKIEEDPFFTFHQDNKKEAEHFIKRVIDNKQPSFSLKIKVKCADGIFRNTQISGSLIERSEGYPYLSLILIDIDSQERLNYTRQIDFMHSVFSEVLELDYAKNTSRMIKGASSKKEISGTKSLDETVQLWAEKYVHPEDRSSFLNFISPKNILDTKKDRKNLSFEYRTSPENGKVQFYRTVMLPMEQKVFMMCNSCIGEENKA